MVAVPSWVDEASCWVPVVLGGQVKLQVRIPQPATWSLRAAEQIAAAAVRQVCERLAETRYVAFPRPEHRTGRVYQLLPDGTTGPAVWRYRCRLGEEPRVLQARLRSPVVLKEAMELELLAVSLAGGPLCLPDLEVELFDIREPGWVVTPRRL